MKNYYRTNDDFEWPERRIKSYLQIENIYDNKGMAVKVELECGHFCILTGEAIQNTSTIRCKPCGMK